MGRGGSGGTRSAGRSYGGGYNSYEGAAGGSRLRKRSSASSVFTAPFDEQYWKEVKWMYNLTDESRCRLGLELLDTCEENRGPGAPECEKYRQVLADCCSGRRAGAPRCPKASSTDRALGDDKTWMYKLSDGSRCRWGLELLNMCENIRSPGASECDKYREVLDGCLMAERRDKRH